MVKNAYSEDLAQPEDLPVSARLKPRKSGRSSTFLVELSL
jgi:hypothetical protein